MRETAFPFLGPPHAHEHSTQPVQYGPTKSKVQRCDTDARCDSQDENKQIFKCPLYRTSTRCDSSRSNALAKNALVLEVDVPCAPPGGTKGAHLVYVKRGTALLIQSEGA